ncbi:hypothetical protein NPIL_496311 [Nephila pilipes]|uniref:Uncharacterized protein n=1 Tax=Nephila pilipes TaxID=299642 RepID=A0A8X6U5W7_NEPPI|nr:hypothetical protein NPIL_496311 [Nephila pilipes]
MKGKFLRSVEATSDTIMHLFAYTMFCTLAVLFSSVDAAGRSLRSSSSTLCRPSLNTQHQLPTIGRDMICSPYRVCWCSWMTSSTCPFISDNNMHLHGRPHCRTRWSVASLFSSSL